MKNINKQAMALAWALLKAHTVMTSKAKSFRYFLGIAYKMLKNENHFAYVLDGLVKVLHKMERNPLVSVERQSLYLASLLKIEAIAPYDVFVIVMLDNY